MSANPSRGLRNNNPGNIRKGKDKWQGLAKEQPDKEFLTFQGPEWGIRAMARLLIRYQDQHDQKTISAIIKRWAPETENNTKAYISAVAKQTGFAPYMPLDMHTHAHLAPLVKAIIRHENGAQPYDDATINYGLALAGVPATPKPLAKSRTITGAKVAAGGTVASGAVEALQPVIQAQQALQPLTEYLEIARWILLALVLIGVGITVYARIDDQKRKIA